MAQLELPLARPSPGRHEDPDRFEIINGQRVELPPMSARATVIAFEFARLLAAFAIERRLGVVSTEVLVRLQTTPDLQRRPDVAFVSTSRLDSLDDSAAWNVIPDLAVEVVSPTNTANEIDQKVHDYFDAGVRAVWVLYPAGRRVYVHESPRGPRVLADSDTLDGGAVLPGFAVSVASLFDMPALSDMINSPV